MKKYNSIENTYRSAFIEKAAATHNLNIPFVVLEKIDGANFGIHLSRTPDGEDVAEFQSRSQKLGSSANFFNFLEVIGKHNLVHKLQILLAEVFPDEGFTIFGELFGGSYAGVSRGSKVQGRVDYCPENMILFYDIFNHHTGSYHSYWEFQNFCETWKLPYVQPIKTCSLDEALDFDVETFKTGIPDAIKSLGNIEYPNKEAEDIAEGVVIRPLDKDLWVGEHRFILKKKSSKFSENGSRRKKNHSIPENIPDLSAYINENRVRSAISKYPEDVKPGVIIAETVNDAIEDYIKEHGVLDSDILNAVRKTISKLVYPIYLKVKE